MSGHQLYMWPGTRTHILKRHDFYVAQVKKRVLAQFSDIEGDAERFGEEEYARLGSSWGGEDSDMGAVAETAHDRAQGFYGLLHDLRRQMLLGALAGCYHQWDKELREFLEYELSRTVLQEYARKLVWGSNISKVFDLLKEFKWDCRTEIFFARMEACRLVVNVYKHGKGASLDQLAAAYPEFLRNLLAEVVPGMGALVLDHEHLEVSEAQFDELAAALRTFWTAFPERLFLPAEQSS